MVELSRRFFLGGAIALIAAQTFKPSANAMSNLPTIYGNGLEDDSFGIAALFRNEPVIFKDDQIGVEDHKGIIFKKGNFLILHTVDVPKELNLEIEYANFSDAVLELSKSKNSYMTNVVRDGKINYEQCDEIAMLGKPKIFLEPGNPFFRFYNKDRPYDGECFRNKACFVTNVGSRPLIENVGFVV